jgi:hypothetical protein
MHREGEEVRSAKEDLHTIGSRQALETSAESYTRRLSPANGLYGAFQVSPAPGAAPAPV